MSEMNLILERWGVYLQEQFVSCPAQPVDIDTFMTGLELAMMEPAVRKEKIDQLRKQKEKVENLNKVLEVVEQLSGLVSVVPGVQGASAVGMLGAGFVKLLGTTINSRQQNKTNKGVASVLRLLCIDTALLDTIDNEIEKTYWANSDLQQEVESYIARARANTTPDPMPDFTKHLVDWLNSASESPYAATGTPGVDTDIVVR